MNQKIAFFVDGGFFSRRIDFFRRKYFHAQTLTTEQIIQVLYRLTAKHQRALSRSELYRIYYYDSPPFSDQMREPVPREGHENLSTRSFKRDERVIFQQQLHTQLSQCRKLALRMGQLANSKRWILCDNIQKDLLSGNMTIQDLRPEHFFLDLQQKQVDTKLGIDIASLAMNHRADTFVLIAGDSDFVPAAKLARRYGVDVILDPLYGNVTNDLDKHIDGKKSFDMVSILSSILNTQPHPLPDWWNHQEDAEPANEPELAVNDR